MIYREFQGIQLSQLGFGTMRLPLLADGTIDEPQVQKMTDYAMEHGINYFDTAYPYHGGNSERVIGRALKKYPRESFYLADKYPGHQVAAVYDPAAIFEEQLEKCGVDYFDFYLLHNVYENSMDVYLDPQWGILDYFKEQKRLGRIKHLGFSSHARVETLKKFLEICGDDMEFCQIQLNYLDWTLQQAKEKCELLAEHNIPVWVMEPVRGGKLAKLSEEQEKEMKTLRPEESIAAWALRFLQEIPGVTVILSGMSNMEQMTDNVKTFEKRNPLSAEETNIIFEVAEGMKDSVPCTACRYCCDGCPKGLNIPMLLAVYNEIRVTPNVNSVMSIQFMPEDKKPTACIACGKCMKICPQNINIPQAFKDMNEIMKGIPSWLDICKEREEAAKRK